MAERSFRFHWWYLFLLLPVALYLGARWYVGHRIDRAIASANDDGNSLTVGEYAYSLFPLRLTARDVTFEQNRSNFSARGRLTLLEADRLHLFSLVGADPIELELIRLQGLDAELRRTGQNNSDSSSLALEVAEIELDSIFLDVYDEVNPQEVHLTNFALSLQSFQLPFQPTGIESLRITADSTVYARANNNLRMVASGIGYGTGSESIAVAELRVRRDSGTDLRAERLTLTGINAQDLEGTLSIDSVSVDYLGGAAQVNNSSGNGKDSNGSKTAFQIGSLQLPTIDVRVSGSFGEVNYAGQVSARDMAYRDSLTVGQLAVASDSLRFSNQDGVAAVLRRLQIEQENLRIPLAPGRLGPTVLNLPDFALTLKDQEIRGADLNYQSATGELTAANLQFEGNKINGTTERLAVTGFDRTGLLADRPATVEQVTLTDAELAVYTGDGGHYAFRLPEVQVDAVQVQKPIVAGRARLQNASFARYGSNGRKDMQGTGIYVTQRNIPLPFDPHRLGPGNVRMDKLHIIGSEDLPVDYYFVKIAYDSEDRLLTLDSLQRRTRPEPGELFERKIVKSHMNFGFDGLRIRGIRQDSLLSGELVYIDSLAANDFRLRVVEDLSINLERPARPMPIEALRKVGPRIMIKHARFPSTDIAYGVVDSIMEPKTIHFTDGTIVLENLDTEVSSGDSTLAQIDATFEETTPLHAEFRLSHGPSGRDYSARGELGEYDVSRVNPLMRVAAGAIIEAGVIEQITYDASMQNDTIRGDMAMLYRNLDVKIVDGGGAWIKNLLSGVVVKDANHRGEDFRPGQIFHEHIATKSFFNSYWKGLVSGMKSTALSDIALPDELE